MQKSQQVLILMCRYPYDGPVKTRLAQALGANQAANLYAAFLKDIFLWAADSEDFDLLISIANDQHLTVFADDFDLPPQNVFAQQAGDLGDRLTLSLQEALGRGYQRVALAASDAPELSHKATITAFCALDDHDISIIPAPDGGYTLLAMKGEFDLFREIAWSTTHVLAQTLQLAQDRMLKVAILPQVADIDDLGDLARLGGLLEDCPELRDRLPNTSRLLQWAAHQKGS